MADEKCGNVRERVPVMASARGHASHRVLSHPASGPYREALYSRDYFFLYNWAWYHWVGMLAPLAILALFWRRNLRGTQAGICALSFAMLPFGLLSIGAASSSPVLHRLTCLPACSRCGRSISSPLVLVAAAQRRRRRISGQRIAPGCRGAGSPARRRHVLRGARHLSATVRRSNCPPQTSSNPLGEHAAVGAKQHAAGCRLRCGLALLHG